MGWPSGRVRTLRLHGQKNSSCSEELPPVEVLESSLPEEDESGCSAVKDTGEMVCIVREGMAFSIRSVAVSLCMLRIFFACRNNESELVIMQGCGSEKNVLGMKRGARFHCLLCLWRGQCVKQYKCPRCVAGISRTFQMGGHKTPRATLFDTMPAQGFRNSLGTGISVFMIRHKCFYDRVWSYELRYDERYAGKNFRD